MNIGAEISIDQGYQEIKLIERKESRVFDRHNGHKSKLKGRGNNLTQQGAGDWINQSRWEKRSKLESITYPGEQFRISPAGTHLGWSEQQMMRPRLVSKPYPII